MAAKVALDMAIVAEEKAEALETQGTGRPKAGSKGREVAQVRVKREDSQRENNPKRWK